MFSATPVRRPSAWTIMLAAVVLSAGFASGQDAVADGAPPPDVSALMDTPVSELQLRLAPLRADELEAQIDAVRAAMERTARSLADRIIAQQRLAAGDGGEAELAEAAEQVKALRERRNALVARANIILDALEAKGGDVAAARRYVKVVAAIEPQLSEGLDAGQVEPTELDTRVASKIAFVRDQPPIHERPEPWAVPVSELELELQPLQVEQLKERVEIWIAMLQREVRERVRIDIALANSTDDAEQQALAERSAEQQRVVLAIVARIQAMLKTLKARGGEVDAYQQYIANATGQKLNLTNPAILWAQVKSWIKSPDGGVKIGVNLLKFLAVLVAFWVLARLLGAAIATALKRNQATSQLLRDFLVLGTRRAVMLIGFVVGLSVLGMNIGPLIAAIGAAGLVIGLALQGTLSNFATGLLILIYRPFDVGDAIHAGGVLGKVEAVTLMSTRLLTFDNQVMLVPNNKIWGDVITNITKLDTRRVDLVFGIAYGDDIDKAEQIIESVVKAHPKVLVDPAPTIKVHELGDSSVNLIVRPWSKTADYWDVYWDLTRQIKQRFDAEGINIPFPQRDLHLGGPIEVVIGRSPDPGEPAGLPGK